jgi:gamma-butyrobetaine dioxygenase
MLSTKFLGATAKGSEVVLQCDEEKTLRFPSVWLRDNCRCQQCFLPTSISRKLLLKNLDPAVQVAEAKVLVDNQVIS